MRAVIQRVQHAGVRIVGCDTVAAYEKKGADEAKEADEAKGENHVMNRSIIDIKGEVLVVSQFTLYASYKKGNRPSWFKAGSHEHSIPLYEAFCKGMEEQLGKQVGTGEFGADMKVELVNDGPVTICMDTKNKE